LKEEPLSPIHVRWDTQRGIETYMFLESVKREMSSDARGTHNVEDDLHVPWKKVLHKWNWPLLEGFLHHRIYN
jgi:hypothetical protein